MIHGSLFTGIGCWNYAADKLGWQTAFNCEISKFCQTILKYFWPDTENFENIYESDFTKYANKIDVLSGSCPCQPFSVAGKRKGSADDRHLWPQMLRAIRESSPVWICYENVPGITHIENGMVFEQVSSDLEAEGYETAPPLIIPACAKDAVHRRDRIWIVAYSNSERITRRFWNWPKQRKASDDAKSFSQKYAANTEGLRWDSEAQPENGEEKNGEQWRCGFVNSNNDVANTAEQGLEGNARTGILKAGISRLAEGNSKESWPEAATRLCGVDDGFAGRLDTISISKSRWRTESLKAYGNAIYWPIAYELFKSIEYASKCKNNKNHIP